MDGVAVTAEYAAPAGCPSDADFWEAFSSRAQHAVRSEHGEWRLVVRLERSKNRFAGTLRVLHGVPPAEALVRSLDDDSCRDLATALAVVGAITIESAPRAPRQPEPPPTDSPIDVPPPVLPPERINLRVGVESTATSFLSPVASAGIGGFFEAEAPNGIFALRGRLGVHFATSFPFQVAVAKAVVSSVFVRAEVGGLRLRFARALALRVAALADVGALIVEGKDALDVQTVSAPWVDVGAVVRFAWETPIFFVEIGGGGVVPITRPRFQFDKPGQAPVVAFEVPAAGAMGEVGVGVRFF